MEFENDTFWVFPYWWGDCECGWQEFENRYFENMNEIQHRNYCYQTRLEEEKLKAGWYKEDWGNGIVLLEKPDKWKFDKEYNELLKIVSRLCTEFGWDTDKINWEYGCEVWCNCDYYDRMDKIYEKLIKNFGGEIELGGHKQNCPLVKDNFHYKLTGFGIQWYKYPLRDSYMNQDINLEQFKKIIDDCIKSLEI